MLRPENRPPTGWPPHAHSCLRPSLIPLFSRPRAPLHPPIPFSASCRTAHPSPRHSRASYKSCPLPSPAVLTLPIRFSAHCFPSRPPRETAPTGKPRPPWCQAADAGVNHSFRLPTASPAPAPSHTPAISALRLLAFLLLFGPGLGDWGSLRFHPGLSLLPHTPPRRALLLPLIKPLNLTTTGWLLWPSSLP